MASVAGMINLNNESTSEAASRGSARSRQEVWLLLTPEPPRPCLPFTPPPTARRSDVRATCMYNLSHVDYVCDCGHQCEGDCCKKKIPTGFLIQNKPKRWSVTLVSLDYVICAELAQRGSSRPFQLEDSLKHIYIIPYEWTLWTIYFLHMREKLCLCFLKQQTWSH